MHIFIGQAQVRTESLTLPVERVTIQNLIVALIDREVNTENFFRNLIKSYGNQIVFYHFWIDFKPNGRPFGYK